MTTRIASSAGQPSLLRNQPWWTPADDAEQTLLAHEFVGTAFTHRVACETCRPGEPWCPQLAEAFDAVLEWRAGRILRSKAAWLRRQQDELEWEAAA